MATFLKFIILLIIPSIAFAQNTKPLIVTDNGTQTCNTTRMIVSTGTLTCNGSVATIVTGGGGAGSWTLTDGTNTVTGVTQVTVTGGVVGGSTPNATLNIAGNLDGGSALSIYLPSQILDGGNA